MQSILSLAVTYNEIVRSAKNMSAAGSSDHWVAKRKVIAICILYPAVWLFVKIGLRSQYLMIFVMLAGFVGAMVYYGLAARRLAKLLSAMSGSAATEKKNSAMNQKIKGLIRTTKTVSLGILGIIGLTFCYAGLGLNLASVDALLANHWRTCPGTAPRPNCCCAFLPRLCFCWSAQADPSGRPPRKGDVFPFMNFAICCINYQSDFLAYTLLKQASLKKSKAKNGKVGPSAGSSNSSSVAAASSTNSTASVNSTAGKASSAGISEFSSAASSNPTAASSSSGASTSIPLST